MLGGFSLKTKRELTPANIVYRVFAAIRAQPAGYGVDVDAEGYKYTFGKHNLYILWVMSGPEKGGRVGCCL